MGQGSEHDVYSGKDLEALISQPSQACLPLHTPVSRADELLELKPRKDQSLYLRRATNALALNKYRLKEVPGKDHRALLDN